LIQNKKAVLYLMSGAILLGYLPWYNFSAVLPIMKQDLGLTGFQVGNILGAFQAGYVLMVIITGWLADRFGARRVVLAGTLGVAACSSAFAFLHGSHILILRIYRNVRRSCAPGMVLSRNGSQWERFCNWGLHWCRRPGPRRLIFHRWSHCSL
jgi:MFS family permease